MHIGKDSKNTLVERTVIRQSDNDISVSCDKDEVYLRDNVFHALECVRQAVFRATSLLRD